MKLFGGSHMLAKFLESPFEKIAKIISRQYGIHVSFKGKQAYTDGKSIILPAISPDDKNENFAKDLEGYLDHEVAHCIFSNFNDLEPVQKNKLAKEMTNAVEDLRIEKEMMKEYPGTYDNLVPLRNKWTKIVNEKWGDMIPAHRIINNVTNIVENKKLRLDKDIKHLFTKDTIALARTLQNADNTKQVTVTVLKLVKLFDELTEKEKERIKQENKEKDNNEDENNENKEKGKEKNKKYEKDSGKSKKTKDHHKDDNEEDETENNAEDTEEESKSSEKTEENTSKSKKNKKSKKSEDESKSKNKRDDSSEKEDSLDQEDLDDFEDNMDDYNNNKEEKSIHDLDSYMNQEIEENVKKETIKSRSERTHIPFTTEQDQFIDMRKESRVASSWFQTAKEEARQVSSVLSLELERLLKVKENEKWLIERERGKIFTGKLASLIADPNYRTPFKEKISIDTKNVVIQLVVDMSGSMHGEQIIVAVKSVIAMSMALQKLDIAHEIVGFNTDSKKLTDTSHKYDWSYYNRIDAFLRHYLFKDINERNLDALTYADRIAYDACNCDGESICFFAKRIADRKEKRKIMFVFSDGEPHIGEGSVDILANDLTKAVQQIKQEGIEIIGIGIKTNAVQKFYDEYIIVNKLEDLAKESLKELKKILLRG